MKNVLFLSALLCIIISSCSTSHLFDKKHIEGVVIATPVSSEEFGQIEMHQGLNIADSYMALYKEEGHKFEIGDSVYFKVKEIKGIPLAHDISHHKPSSLYGATPKTNLNYHSFEKKGRTHGWHRVGHMVIESLAPQSNGTIKIWSTDGTIKEHVLDSNLVAMADSIYKSQTTDNYGPTMTKYRIFYGLEGNKVMSLDTFHRHGLEIIDTGGRPR